MLEVNIRGKKRSKHGETQTRRDQHPGAVPQLPACGAAPLPSSPCPQTSFPCHLSGVSVANGMISLVEPDN